MLEKLKKNLDYLLIDNTYYEGNVFVFLLLIYELHAINEYLCQTPKHRFLYILELYSLIE